MKNGEMYCQFAIHHSSCKDTYSITTFLIFDINVFCTHKKRDAFSGHPFGLVSNMMFSRFRCAASGLSSPGR